ncbi:DUF2922 domain-containing protein [Clostridium intestinale]|jgi:hypothetical protein|uniref:DUF2922 domain-containing protein n=1 Tax=Clostridium intestinale DSM 6191 TaxID=1121320 RepID=A0A1M5T376_9CLOT|nr:DUF2922 domain-containing protein [Clostridium intestinale]MDF2950099.1 hypothetical protein [Sedimentibacter sp.]SHH45148.1 Protein of unknown function [Clostridium intestinale DSM 6191]
MKLSLILTFLTSNGERSTLTISDVKNGITPEDVAELVAVILRENIFATKNGDLVTFKSARVDEKRSTILEVPV